MGSKFGKTLNEIYTADLAVDPELARQAISGWLRDSGLLQGWVNGYVLKVRKGLEFGISGLKSCSERNGGREKEAWAGSGIYPVPAATVFNHCAPQLRQQKLKCFGGFLPLAQRFLTSCKPLWVSYQEHTENSDPLIKCWKSKPLVLTLLRLIEFDDLFFLLLTVGHSRNQSI